MSNVVFTAILVGPRISNPGVENLSELSNYIICLSFTGPLALLPLDDEHSSLVWSTSHQRCKELMSMSGDDLVKEINSAFVRINCLFL